VGILLLRICNKAIKQRLENAKLLDIQYERRCSSLEKMTNQQFPHLLEEQTLESTTQPNTEDNHSWNHPAADLQTINLLNTPSSDGNNSRKQFNDSQNTRLDHSNTSNSQNELCAIEKLESGPIKLFSEVTKEKKAEKKASFWRNFQFAIIQFSAKIGLIELSLKEVEKSSSMGFDCSLSLSLSASSFPEIHDQQQPESPPSLIALESSPDISEMI
jgi:regulator of extracellular matrix RemA (YlzA/DUF370 family)